MVRELKALNEFVEFHCDQQNPPLIELFQVQEDRSITTFVLFTYLKEGSDIFDFDCEVNACLLYFDGKKYQRVSEETKKFFAEDQPAFVYCWFDFD